MIVLGIDTSTIAASVALVRDGVALGEAALDVAPGAARNPTGARLLAMIDELCRAHGVAPHALGAVAVGAGPGSFTGLRIGLATGKGIAFAAGTPLWQVSSLAALAHSVLGRVLASDGDAALAVLDARRGEVFAGGYARRGEAIARIADERVIAPTELVSMLAAIRATHASVRVVGDSPAIAELAAPGEAWRHTPRAFSVVTLALAGPRTNELAHGTPTYIRASEAEIRYPDGVPGALRRSRDA